MSSGNNFCGAFIPFCGLKSLKRDFRTRGICGCVELYKIAEFFCQILRQIGPNFGFEGIFWFWDFQNMIQDQDP